jgi:hypothetical protein
MIGDRWNVTDDEMTRPYPCNDFVRPAIVQAWRGVTVNAAPEAVWPWITQIRLAPYSYDWIDNLGRQSPRKIVDQSPPVVGEHFTTAGGVRLGRIIGVDPRVHFTGRIGLVAISYVLDEQANSTRLLMKIAANVPSWVAPPFVVADLVMARRQLLNLKGLVEGRITARGPR